MLMGKLDLNKKQKRESLLNTAFHLFMTNGINKTTISDIVNNAGVAKGTFYLYFKDKYDIRNKLVSHKASLLFSAAIEALKTLPTPFAFEDQIIYIVDFIIDQLDSDKALLQFLSKNLSWGVFKNALIRPAFEDDINCYDIYMDTIKNSGFSFRDPEIMLFLIIELIDASIYSPILYNEPVNIQQLKPDLYDTIRYILNSHKEETP